MKLRFFDDFDRIVIVSLPYRTDRRRDMVRELRRVNLQDDPRVQFFDAYSLESRGCFRSVGSHGCYMSHLAILTEAGEARQRVLVLQDDCQFLPGILSYRMPEGTDVFYGGFRASDPADLKNSNIAGAHFMGFSADAARAASRYLSDLLQLTIPPDAKAAAETEFDPAIRPPIDGALVWFRRAHPQFKTEFKLLGIQRSSRSDVEPKRLDMVWGARRLVDAVRKVKSRSSSMFAWRGAPPHS